MSEKHPLENQLKQLKLKRLIELNFIEKAEYQ